MQRPAWREPGIGEPAVDSARIARVVGGRKGGGRMLKTLGAAAVGPGAATGQRDS
jgi:hypothetical protein